MWCIFKYNTSPFAKIVKYFLGGSIVTTSQFLSLFIFVEFLDWKNVPQQSIANASAIAVSILSGYLIHSRFTWPILTPSPKNKRIRFLKFYFVSLASLFLRALVFFALSLTGINYLSNAAIGVVLVVFLNFVVYEKFVFRESNFKT
ncbi:MAG TPA: GtrA family protein [Turneriella sp.]|nr:GtrA family protein [Turneriella sp.]